MQKRYSRGDNSRSALVYEVTGKPVLFRTRVAKYPEHSDASTDWFGGRVLWGHDKNVFHDAEVIAEFWVNEGVLPDGWFS